ncbi:MAG: Nif3-like dinuclear metal center hexameric protein, partial [Myxococcota bacterium]
MKLSDVITVLETLADPSHAADWDNVGLLAGDREASVRRVAVCIDMMPAVVDEALAQESDLIVAYHPPLFRP